jgi:hypothetical protein
LTGWECRAGVGQFTPLPGIPSPSSSGISGSERASSSHHRSKHRGAAARAARAWWPGQEPYGDSLALQGWELRITPEGEIDMSRHMMFGIGGVILGLILFIVSPWLALAVIVLAIAVPVIAWRMLDPSQRRRIRQMRDRGQLGR